MRRESEKEGERKKALCLKLNIILCIEASNRFHCVFSSISMTRSLSRRHFFPQLLFYSCFLRCRCVFLSRSDGYRRTQYGIILCLDISLSSFDLSTFFFFLIAYSYSVFLFLILHLIMHDISTCLFLEFHSDRYNKI